MLPNGEIKACNLAGICFWNEGAWIEGPFFGGKHPKMKKGNQTVVIPNKHESEIGVGFLTRLLRQAAISKDVWLNK